MRSVKEVLKEKGIVLIPVRKVLQDLEYLVEDREALITLRGRYIEEGIDAEMLNVILTRNRMQIISHLDKLQGWLAEKSVSGDSK